jgi:hypothetical protein
VKLLKRSLKIIAALALVLAVLACIQFFFRQEKFIFACRACHEMRTHKTNLSFARHEGVDCVKCHVLESVYDMAVIKYFKPEKKYKNITVADARCSACHPDIKDQTVFYHDVPFSHTAHLEAGEHCSKCHRSFVHRKSRTSPLISLRQCRDCHEKKRRTHTPPTTIRDLGELEKQPHDDGWYVDHKNIKKAEEKSCAECHHKDFCTACHDNYKDHVDNWWANHYQEAMIRLPECQICHRPDYCISCHKQRIPTTHRTKEWGMNHWTGINLVECNTCHTLNFCKSCHTRNQPKSHATIKDHAGMKPSMEPTCDVCHQKNSCSSCHHSETQGAACGSCHEKAASSTVKTAQGTMSHERHTGQGGVLCTECHRNAPEPGRFQTRNDCMACHHSPERKSCLSCHSGIFDTVVRVNNRSFSHKRHTGPADLTCTTCHRADGTGRFTNEQGCSSCHHSKQQRKTCYACHGDILKKTVSSSNKKFSHDSHVNTHGVPCHKCHVFANTRTGLRNAYDCNSCHHNQAGGNCKSCHPVQQRETAKSSMDYECEFCHKIDGPNFSDPRGNCRSCHALAYSQEVQAHGAKSCDTCHPPHSWAYGKGTPCVKCHAKPEAMHKRDIKGMKCTDCHEPHIWRAAPPR